MLPAEGITLNAFEVTLSTTDIDWSSANGVETRMGQRVGDTLNSQDIIQAGFNLNSYIPDREGESYIEDWEKTWLSV